MLKAARALAERIEGLTLGSFALTKRLPVAAGSAAARRTRRRLCAFWRAPTALRSTIPRLMQAAQATGADVPVCLDPTPRVMRGIGDVLSAPLDLAAACPRCWSIHGVTVPTKDVFAALDLQPVPQAAAS